jgi:hypothetical protein
MDLAMFCLVNFEEFESVNAQIEALLSIEKQMTSQKAAHSEEGRRREMTLDYFIVWSFLFLPVV